MPFHKSFCVTTNHQVKKGVTKFVKIELKNKDQKTENSLSESILKSRTKPKTEVESLTMIPEHFDFTSMDPDVLCPKYERYTIFQAQNA